MNYSFQNYPDGETCSNCSSSIQSGWEINGQVFGPTCGKRVLKSNGVTFTSKIGPSAFNPQTLQEATRIYNTWIEAKRQNVYPNPVSKDELNSIKTAVGSVAWKIIQQVNNRLPVFTGTEEALAIYQIVREL